MKKLFMFIAFLGLVNMAQAQCTKSAKTAANGAKTACCAKTMAAATKAASMNEAVEKRVCEKSGKVSFVKKSVCEKSGNVSFANVEYCTKSQKFVNVSPSDVKAVNASMGGAKKPACSKAAKAACSKSKAACSKTAKAACSKSKAACSKSKTAATKVEKEVKEVKAVKVSNEQ